MDENSRVYMIMGGRFTLKEYRFYYKHARSLGATVAEARRVTHLQIRYTNDAIRALEPIRAIFAQLARKRGQS